MPISTEVMVTYNRDRKSALHPACPPLESTPAITKCIFVQKLGPNLSKEEISTFVMV